MKCIWFGTRELYVPRLFIDSALPTNFALPAFVNEYKVKDSVDVLKAYGISYDPKFESVYRFRFKAASQLSSVLTEELKVPVASLGGTIYAKPDVKMMRSFTFTMKLEGTPAEVEVQLDSRGDLVRSDPAYPDVIRRYINRAVDLLMTSQGYFQDGRGFYENSPKDLGKLYASYSGFYVSALALSDGHFALVVDPANLVRAKSNLLVALQEELKKRGLASWKDAAPFQSEVNKAFRSRAFSLRSTYTERRPEDPEPSYNTYKFGGFDFSHGLEENSDPRSPVNFHRSFDREFTLDQPIITVIARGGRQVSHIPELLEEHPTMSMLRRLGVSERIQARSQMDAASRYYMTTEHAEALLKAGLIETQPISVDTKDFGPVRITIEGGYIELKTNYDFQKLFDKKKVLVKPKIKNMRVFASEKTADVAKSLASSLEDAFKEFSISGVTFEIDSACPNTLDDFVKHILDKAAENRFDEQDFVLIVFDFSDEDTQDLAYETIKGQTLAKLFPTQFVTGKVLRDENRNLRKDVVNPLLLQVVAKGGGQPYGLQPGFVPVGTFFVGIDRYRHPFKPDAPLVTSITLFDSRGVYVCGGADVNTQRGEEEIALARLMKECVREFKKITHTDTWSLGIFLIDTGVGTQADQMRADASICAAAAEELGASYAFVASNKDSHLRLYQGDPSDSLGAEKVSAFTAAVKMEDPKDVLVTSTEPIVAKATGKTIGTQRPVLYRVLSKSDTVESLELKELVAKSVVWLCRHSWVSPSATRLPAPIDFANKLSRLAAIGGTSLRPDALEAPRFL